MQLGGVTGAFADDVVVALDEAGIEGNATAIDVPEACDLPPGEWRSLTKELLATLYSIPTSRPKPRSSGHS